jgi:hypothetical protein
MSGYGWLSLTEFMLDPQAVANAFHSPTRQVGLRSQEIERQTVYLQCRKLEGIMNWDGNDIFTFQLEVNSSELSSEPPLLS